MNRRHTITTKPNNDYPEHLNPFSDDGDDTTNNNKSASSLGRRNSRLTASFRSINSWSIFSSKKSKKEDRKGNELPKPDKDKDKYMTLTMKHKSHILNTKSDGKPLNLNGTEDTPRRTPTREPCEEFKLTPKSDRYRSHSMTSAAPVPERRVGPGQCPVPLPRRIITQSERSVIENEVPSTSTERRPTLKIEEDEGKYIQQGARPKKKRRAPLPPTLPPTITTTHATINNTESNASEPGHVASNSEETADARLSRTTAAGSSQSTAIQHDGNDASSSTTRSTQPNAVPASRTPTVSSSRPIVVPSPRKTIAATEASVVPSPTTTMTRTDKPYMLPSSRTVTSGTESTAVTDLKDETGARDERTAVPVAETTSPIAKPTVLPGSRTITSRTEKTTVVPVSRTITSRTESTIVPSPRTVISRTEETTVVPGYRRPITSRTIIAVPYSTKVSVTESGPVSRTATTSIQLTSVPDTRTTIFNAEPSTLDSRTTTFNEPVPSPAVTSSVDATEVTGNGTTTTHEYLKVVPDSITTEQNVVPRQQLELETATEEEQEQKQLLDEKILIEKVEKLTNLIISS